MASTETPSTADRDGRDEPAPPPPAEASGGLLRAVAAWALVGALFGATSLTVRPADGDAGSGLFLSQFLYWIAWIPLTPAIHALCRRYRLGARTWRRRVAVHLAATLPITLAQTLLAHLLMVAAGSALASPLGGRRLTSAGVLSSVVLGIFVYWVVVGLLHAFQYYRLAQQQRLDLAELETRLTRAQLDALRLQLQPHFLFNALNSVLVLMDDDVGEAQRMLDRLSGLLRQLLERRPRQLVPLEQEMETLDRYLEIEQVRFADRLRVRRRIDADTLTGAVPSLILQPLVENAIRHGIARRAEGGVVEVAAQRRGESLCLRIRDDGPGDETGRAGGAVQGGIGLGNTQARLTQLFGDDHHFVAHADEGGRSFEVRIEIPWIPAEGAGAADPAATGAGAGGAVSGR